MATGPVLPDTMRRLAEPARPRSLEGAPAPALRLEPVADCGRHDSLRGARHVHWAAASPGHAPVRHGRRLGRAPGRGPRAPRDAGRQARSLRCQTGVARLPVHRDLAGFAWAEAPLRQAEAEQLAAAGFMDQARNLILVGGAGAGKSHPATAAGVAAIRLGKRVRLYNAVDLANRLEREKQQGKAGSLAEQPIQADAAILDELGCLPLPDAGRALLFHLASQLYEKTSLVI